MEMTVPQIPVIVNLVEYDLDNGWTNKEIFAGPMIAVPRCQDDLVIEGTIYLVSKVSWNPCGAVLAVMATRS